MKNYPSIIFLALLFAIFMTPVEGISQQDPSLPVPIIQSPWADQVGIIPHPEYPRPQMSRSAWTNLNGHWDYAIREKGATQPANFDGKILVPFPVESKLSGVGKTVGASNELWYRRSFEVSPDMRRSTLLLHFGAVDWESEVFINGQSAGVHRGGYDPFSFDISTLLKPGKSQELMVRVWDPTDEGPQPRGKQVNKPRGIWYTPVTGIWQTVWLETVPATYIAGLKNTPDLDNNQIVVTANVKNGKAGQLLRVRYAGRR
jgi:beta-galactosidase/beta-glucuronidase